MAARPNWPNWQSDLALLAAAILGAMTVHRHLTRLPRSPKAGPHTVPVNTDAGKPGWLSQGPLEITAAGWRNILFRTYRQIDEDRLIPTAAGIVFYGLLATFPAITALVSSYGLFADPSTISANLQSLALMLPEGSFAIVQDQIARVLAKGTSTLSLTFILGLLMAIWSANAGMKAIIDALNVVYEEKEKRGVLKLNLVSLAFTIASLAAILVMVGAIVVIPLLLQQVGLGARAELIIRFGRWPILTALLLTALAVLYRYAPSRTEPRWQWLSVGAVAAAVLWLVGSSLLSWYLSNFGNYNATYGSLGAAIGLMTWMWMSAIILLCGAELNSEIEHQTIVDSTKGRPLGARDAARDKTIGKAV
nr:YihY/virulence factor BrkB family protein [Bradyrhizobium jicamae]